MYIEEHIFSEIDKLKRYMDLFGRGKKTIIRHYLCVTPIRRELEEVLKECKRLKEYDE